MCVCVCVLVGRWVWWVGAFAWAYLNMVNAMGIIVLKLLKYFGCTLGMWEAVCGDVMRRKCASAQTLPY